MKHIRLLGAVLLLFCCSISQAQQFVATDTTVVVPPLVRFSGVLTDNNGRLINAETDVTFLLYKDSQGGSPLWMESQTVNPDITGHYSVMLGATSSQGLPVDIFVAGQAHWLAVQVQGQEEQSRVLLVSAPYALKAGDAETIGGLPPSAFVLANGAKQNPAGGPAAATFASAASNMSAPLANSAVTGKGVVDYIPMWDTTSDIIDSVMFEKSSQIGIGTTSPAATLDVNGKGALRDTLTLYPKATDATLAINGTAFKVDQTGNVTFISSQKFPGAGTITGVTTSSTSGLQGGGTTGTLSLSVKSAGVTNAMLQNSAVTLNGNTAGGLTTPGAMTLGSTYTIGLKPCSANQVLQYSGTAWNCTAVGTGTITGVTAGADLTGGGTAGKVTLNLDTTKVPQLAAANTFTGNQTVNGNLSATGMVTGTSFNIGSNLFDFGSYSSLNAFLGFAGNTIMTGTGNTAAGANALLNNYTGSDNTAAGANALIDNDTGSNNTATGFNALLSSAGSNNTATGTQALSSNSSGSGNTAFGYQAGLTNDIDGISGVANTFLGAGTLLGTGTLNNATAIGANAEVDQTNSLVLGSINNVNGATASTNVGIGTTAPNHVLEVNAGAATAAQIAMISSGTDAAISLKNTNTGAGGREYWIDSGAGNAGVGAGTFAVWDATANAVRMVITSKGNMGLGGITGPGYPLQMADGAYESGGTWTNASDRNLKEAFKVVDGKGLLAKLDAIPIESWKYKSEGGQTRHLGPMAQDFYAAFGLGSDDKHISTVDEGGVALAAIQQLYREGQKKDAEICALEEEINRLKSQLGAIQASLKTIGRGRSKVRIVTSAEHASQ